MKLGTQTNSVVNHLYSRATIGQPIPTVGMGATVLSWTDRHAATIVEVISPKFIAITYDTAERTDNAGMSESQEYVYTSNFDDAKRFVKLDKNNAWRPVSKNQNGNFVYDNGNGLRIGERRSYHDFSF